MTEREDRLNALQDAVDTWANGEVARLEEEVSFLQSVFDGRTNSGDLANYITEEASALLQDEVNAFLVE